MTKAFDIIMACEIFDFKNIWKQKKPIIDYAYLRSSLAKSLSLFVSFQHKISLYCVWIKIKWQKLALVWARLIYGAKRSYSMQCSTERSTLTPFLVLNSNEAKCIDAKLVLDRKRLKVLITGSNILWVRFVPLFYFKSRRPICCYFQRFI